MLASLVLLASAGVAQAETIIVNTTSDPGGTNGCLTDGTCSLRDAVAAASSGDTIELGGTSGSPEVYSLTQGTDIQITTSLTLEGGGVTATSIDGSENDGGQGEGAVARILRIDSGATVTIQDLTLTGGFDEEDENCPGGSCETVDENGGGALFNDGGDVTLDDVAFTHNFGDNPVGGGVSNGSGTLDMTNVSFTNDNAFGGGGLFTRSGTITGTGLTFEDDGTGAGGGGAAYLLGGTVSLTNVTVVGSGAGSGIGGGIVNSGATLTLINDTFSGNLRGSIETEEGARTSVGNTIIGAGFSDNINYACVASGQPDDVSGNTSIAAITTDLGANIDQDGHCGLTGPGDQTDVDPMLAPIANNGGATLTQALLPGSPALGAANEANCPSTDQRGDPRANPCDIGAFEALPPAVSDVSVPSVTQTNGTIDFSIDPEGFDTTYVIDYGPTGTYGQQTQPVEIGSGSGAQPLQATITGLSPGTTYHFEVVATNAYGNGASGDNTMTTSPAPSPPASIAPPAITGTAKAGSTLSCSEGSWSNAPTGFVYQWSRDGTPIQGATGDTYTVQNSDEGLTLTCTVTASNAAGSSSPATSTGVPVPVPHVAGCPAATGSLSGGTLGLVRLGMTRGQARRAYTHSSNRGKKYEDFFCLTPIGVRVGYASPTLLKTLPRGERAKLKGRVVWASTSSGYYTIQGVRPGATVTAAGQVLKLTGPFQIGLNTWYLAPNGSSTGVLKVRGGIVEEIGIADKQLTTGHATDVAFLHSFS